MLAGKSNEEICWKVVVSCELDEIGDKKIKHASLKNYFELIGDLADSIINFWSGNLWEQLEELNETIEERINRPRRVVHDRVMKLITRAELLTFIALIIGATNESVQGRNLWGRDNRLTLSTHTDYSRFMNCTCFHKIKAVIHFMMEDKSVQTDDDWWKVRGFVDGFNKRRVEELNTSVAYVLDESMSSMIPRYVPF